MTTLLYRGQNYLQHSDPVVKHCTELTYRREHYNTCRERAKLALHPVLAYRGAKYIK